MCKNPRSTCNVWVFFPRLHFILFVRMYHIVRRRRLLYLGAQKRADVFYYFPILYIDGFSTLFVCGGGNNIKFNTCDILIFSSYFWSAASFLCICIHIFPLHLKIFYILYIWCKYWNESCALWIKCVHTKFMFGFVYTLMYLQLEKYRIKAIGSKDWMNDDFLMARAFVLFGVVWWAYAIRWKLLLVLFLAIDRF